MRVDGSFKELTTGLSTVDRSQHKDRQYMTYCTNFRNDPVNGLSRRAPAKIKQDILSYTDDAGTPRTITDFDPDTDIIKAFEIDGVPYWLYCDVSTDKRMAVFDEDGVAQTLNVYDNTYLQSALGNDSIRTVSSDQSVYVVNTEVTAEALENSGPVYTNHSMLACRRSPLVYSTLTVRWDYPDYLQGFCNYEIGEDHPDQPIEDIDDVDNGTNEISRLLAAKIEAQILADGYASALEIDREGSTIVFRNVTTGQFQRPFSNVTIEDGTNAFTAINGQVDSIELLPRFANAGSLVTVSPDPETGRGSFYMRSRAVLEAVAPDPLPAVDFTFTPSVTDSGSAISSLFTTIYGGAGTFTPTAILPSEPSHNCYYFSLTTGSPFVESNKTQVILGMAGPSGDNLVASDIQFVEIWDDTGTSPERIAQVFLYRTLSQSNATNAVDLWEGTIDGAVELVDGRAYNCYLSDVIDSVGLVPECRWEEESAPDENTLLNSRTLPHILYKLPDGTFEFGSFSDVSVNAVPALERRTSGDDISNPMPAYIDSKIRDLAFFQNRLAVLTTDKVSMSVTNQPNDWFRGTVTQLLATSPISVQSTAAQSSTLTHFVEHNNDLMIFSPTGQFRFDGKQALTPANASLAQASSYPCEVLAVPKSAGNDVFFATSYGPSSGLSQFSLDPQIDNLSVAAPMADMQVGLIVGDIQQIVTSPNTGVIMCRTQTNKNRLYVMEFLPQIDILKPLQPTWAYWDFGFGAQLISMRSSGDYVDMMVLPKAGTTDEGQLRLMRVDLFNDRKAFNLWSIDWGDVYLDCQENQLGINTAIDVGADYPVPYEAQTITFVQGPGCPEPGLEVTATGTHPNYTLDVDMLGGQVFYGYTFNSLIWLPKIVSRDRSGVIQTRAQLRITDADVTLTGHVDAIVLTRHTGYPTQEFRGDSYYANAPGIGRSSWRVQIKQPSDELVLAFNTGSHLQCNIHQIEWRGTYNKVGRRF